MISLMKLPYALPALEPHISEDTLATHYGKHHQGYVNKTNAAVGGTALEEKPLEEIIAAAEQSGDNGLYNNAAQVWNHGFYWESMAPKPAAKPSDAIGKMIDRDFGSISALKSKLVEVGAKHFGSGWVWLVHRDQALAVIDSHDAHTLVTGSSKPLLVIDLWEHAYYLDQKNERKKYLELWTTNLLNWNFVNQNFDRRGCWQYPG